MSSGFAGAQNPGAYQHCRQVGAKAERTAYVETKRIGRDYDAYREYIQRGEGDRYHARAVA